MICYFGILPYLGRIATDKNFYLECYRIVLAVWAILIDYFSVRDNQFALFAKGFQNFTAQNNCRIAMFDETWNIIITAGTQWDDIIL